MPIQKKKNIDFNEFRYIILYSFICFVPILFWFKYVYGIEQNNLSELSYFSRFKNDITLLDNIKFGLGISQSPETNKINGIPAFISLFIPITGLRNYFVSVILILLFLVGYIKTSKNTNLKFLLGITILIMVGFIFAGTGFSRYWLILLPSFYLGYYFFFKMFHFKDELFLKLSKIIAVFYVLNELRLDYIILNKYL